MTTVNKEALRDLIRQGNKRAVLAMLEALEKRVTRIEELIAARDRAEQEHAAMLRDEYRAHARHIVDAIRQDLAEGERDGGR